MGVSAGVATIGTVLTGSLGGWDEILQTKLWFMVADMGLGFLASLKLHTTCSEVMLWGGVNKILVLVVVAVGVRLDLTLGLTALYIRTMICWFYLSSEGLSLLENSGKLGFPSFVTKFLAELKVRGTVERRNRRRKPAGRADGPPKMAQIKSGEQVLGHCPSLFSDCPFPIDR